MKQALLSAKRISNLILNSGFVLDVECKFLEIFSRFCKSGIDLLLS
uniref:Uncharacterized protein n=1 Tax=Rhizophora mucronata TaxID=61149 RepID=A0A2P2PIE6_RHIMU